MQATEKMDFEKELMKAFGSVKPSLKDIQKAANENHKFNNIGTSFNKEDISNKLEDILLSQKIIQTDVSKLLYLVTEIKSNIKPQSTIINISSNNRNFENNNNNDNNRRNKENNITKNMGKYGGALALTTSLINNMNNVQIEALTPEAQEQADKWSDINDVIGTTLTGAVGGAAFGGGVPGALVGGGLGLGYGLYNYYTKEKTSTPNTVAKNMIVPSITGGITPTQEQNNKELLNKNPDQTNDIDIKAGQFKLSATGDMTFEGSSNRDILIKGYNIIFEGDNIEFKSKNISKETIIGSHISGSSYGGDGSIQQSTGGFSFKNVASAIFGKGNSRAAGGAGATTNREPVPTNKTGNDYNYTSDPNIKLGNDVNNETFAADDRKKFADELKNPAIVERLKALAIAEVGKNPADQQRLIETIFNRASARKQSLWNTMQSDYYAPFKDGGYAKALEKLKKDKELDTQTSEILDKVIKGSWGAKGTTGNASGQVGFGYGKDKNGNPIYGAGHVQGATGEHFGVENQTADKKWYENKNKEYQDYNKNNTTQSVSPQDQAIAIGKELQAQGLRISENPSFGGVAPVHSGKGHYDGRAIDVNIGGGNVEANDPTMKARFDKTAEDLRKRGYIVIWGSGSHKNHMHVEVPKGGLPQQQNQPSPEMLKKINDILINDSNPTPDKSKITPNSVGIDEVQQRSELDLYNQRKSEVGSQEKKGDTTIALNTSPSNADGAYDFDDIHPHPQFMDIINNSKGNPAIIKSSAEHTMGLDRYSTPRMV